MSSFSLASFIFSLLVGSASVQEGSQDAKADIMGNYPSTYVEEAVEPQNTCEETETI